MVFAILAVVVGTIAAVLWGVNYEDKVFKDPDIDISAGPGPNGEPPYLMGWKDRPELDRDRDEKGYIAPKYESSEASDEEDESVDAAEDEVKPLPVDEVDKSEPPALHINDGLNGSTSHFERRLELPNVDSKAQSDFTVVEVA